MLRTWVMREPQHFEVGQLREVLDLTQIRDVVLPQVQLGQFGASLEIFEGTDPIQGEGNNLHIG